MKQFNRIDIAGNDFDVCLTIKKEEVVKVASTFKVDELKIFLQHFIQGFANSLFLAKEECDNKKNKKRLVAYLCGPMEFAVNFGANWRKWLTKECTTLKIDVEDPCEIEAKDTGLDSTQSMLHEAKKQHDWETLSLVMDQIQDRDFDAIDDSDFLIMLLDHTSGPGGTYCELEYARAIGKPIYAVCLGDLEKENSWIINTILRSKGDIFFSFKDLLKFLKSRSRRS